MNFPVSYLITTVIIILQVSCPTCLVCCLFLFLTLKCGKRSQILSPAKNSWTIWRVISWTTSRYVVYTGIPQIARFLAKSQTVLTENCVNWGRFYYIQSKMGHQFSKVPFFVTFWRKLTIFFLWIFINIMNHNQIPLVSFDNFEFRAIKMR